MTRRQQRVADALRHTQGITVQDWIDYALVLESRGDTEYADLALDCAVELERLLSVGQLPDYSGAAVRQASSHVAAIDAAR